MLVAPVAYQVILEPGIINAGRPGGVSGYPRAWYYRSVSRVRVPPSAYSYKFIGTFSCEQIDLRKARERQLPTLDEKSTSSGLWATKIEGKNRGGEGTAPVSTACLEAGK